ncbi:unnamed protein product [Didymodactylos carnosus]|uniref:Uncharacterized protein n=1 Tax=Didymodactylos carnosus TaxID=1234261 RepID=A0A813W386_9BILA|nr:unnamed protein product [Didymodactylos carnosus]CAF0849129.1 unnamed protein product [Didymodactylos carnosus]CAF3508056.1 unnamed protein product [Didymodactylos carnosus]CAF3636918.1 unnamed protein product [Didymodactylos carnosus]
MFDHGDTVHFIQKMPVRSVKSTIATVDEDDESDDPLLQRLKGLRPGRLKNAVTRTSFNEENDQTTCSSSSSLMPDHNLTNNYYIDVLEFSDCLFVDEIHELHDE